MAWIRLDDDYVHHAKFTALSHQAFRVWHEGMAYCRKMLTDGLISHTALKAFRYASKPTVRELTTPVHPGASPLWEHHQDGYLVHDYLDWNPSSEEDKADREASKRRMRAFRGRQKEPLVTPPVTPNVTPFVTPPVTPNVPGQGKDLRSQERKIEEIPVTEFDHRARNLMERYAELFYKHRRGARYHNRMHLDFHLAQQLVRTWEDDARLEKLAVLVLTTDDDWIAGTDRGFAVFSARASWADGILADWEAEQASKKAIS